VWKRAKQGSCPKQRLELNQGAALKAALATRATCTTSAGKSSTSPRRNISGRSGRGIVVCAIFGKGCVWIGRGCCLRAASPCVLACGKKGRYAKHAQSCRPSRFFSHTETIHARTGDVNRDVAKHAISLAECHRRTGRLICTHFSADPGQITKLSLNLTPIRVKPMIFHWPFNSSSRTNLIRA
jgi:hypothetical protein